ncbi:helix-turn-helix domain-containing protein [Blautia luti]|uniref:helix-turn-helix domain-containing protein n=1 Tax=Blautia luti TaxID=89014 RepID=UPI001D0116EA|nr:helix-turn-helix domain-containing protein [Blautia luti]MCB5474240.1 helix-turn-helix domain-containing protein [Blautia luti]
MEYLTTSEIAEKWNVSRRRVSTLCAEGRIDGAVHKGNLWLIPEDAEKPEDPRHNTKKNKITEVSE